MDTLTLPCRDNAGTTVSQPVRNTGFRTDIQALRAVAVLAVVLNHLWPNRLPGGYVGVDVFFVISGFLITGHLGRELADTGRVRLGRFYARRVRRLLPAAFLVLGFSLVAAYLLLPYPRWAATAQHVLASALYAENWLLAAESVNYSAADAAASLSQHYWSLSVEEQFYLLWPLALLLCGKRIAVVIGVGVASFACCVYLTGASQAYFVTPVRMWEFALGALVALAGARLVLPARVAGLASFAGLAMIVGSAFAFDHTTPFPGYLALVPTVGTALVIMAGARWHTALSAARPVQWLGDVSYSLYLWHWPLILLAPFTFGQTLALPHKLAVLACSLLLAAGTKVLVEDRGRSWRPTARRTFAVMVAGLVVLAVSACGLQWTYGQQVVEAERQTSARAGAPCHGADAMVGPCPDPFGPAQVTAMGPANEYYRLPPECRLTDDNMAGDTKTTNVCDFSGGAPAPEVVWLVGDSHAVQWQGPLVDLARERKWVLKSGTLGGCPFAKIEFIGYRAPATDGFPSACMDWTNRMTDVVAADRPSHVFVSFFARMEFADDGSGRSQPEQYREGLEPLWRKWTGAGARVVVLADPPLNGDVRSADCVTLNATDPLACAVDRAVAQPPDPLSAAARSTNDDPGVSLIDLTDYFCDEQRCYAVIGNVAVYYDANHMNLEFARSLTPMLAGALGAQ
jgi:peptidoglycan/LPS O-acetylase OafA/YrhL